MSERSTLTPPANFRPPEGQPAEKWWAGITLASVFYFGSLAIIYNPFFRLQPQIKFSIFAAMQAIGMLLFIRAGAMREMRIQLWAVVFVQLFLLSAVRVKEIEVIGTGYVQLRFVYLALLTIFTFVTSYVISSQVSIVAIRRSVLIFFIPISFQMVSRFGAMTDWELREVIRFGDFSFDSYQQLSLVLALTALGLIGEFRWSRGHLLRNGIVAALACYFSYYIFQGLARGEAIAFVVAVGLIFAPRVTIVGLPFYAAILSVIVARVESGLTERLSGLLEGDYGMRDILLLDSLTMLAEKPWLLLIGGGVNAFQEHYGLSSGLYPHNILVEAWITGGVFMFFAMTWIYVRPILLELLRAWAGRSTFEDRYALASVVFLMIVMLKSGSLVDMWTLTIFTCLFMRMGGHRALVRINPIRAAGSRSAKSLARPC